MPNDATASRRGLSRRTAERLRHLPWSWLAPVAGGAIVGGLIGAWHKYRATGAGPSSELGPTFAPSLTLVAVLAALAMAGAALMAPRSTRRLGQRVLLAGASVVLAWPVGHAIGPGWQPPRAFAGEVTVVLVEPVAASLTAPATCVTEPDGPRIATVTADELGSIGVDSLAFRIRMGWGDAPDSVGLAVNGRWSYGVRATTFEVGGDGTTGSLAFSDSGDGAVGIGGPGSGAASGSATWVCRRAETLATTPPGEPSEPPGLVQGTFFFGGIIERGKTDDPQTWARATGACSRQFDLRTDALETVVDWLDGRRARLRLVPGRETATLSVDFGSGSPPETVTAKAVLTERRPAVGGQVVDRQLRASFDLRAGRLEVTVDWFCAARFERPAGP